MQHCLCAALEQTNGAAPGECVTWYEVVDEVGHGEERASSVKEVHVKESYERQPQVSIAEIAETAHHTTLQCIRHLHKPTDLPIAKPEEGSFAATRRSRTNLPGCHLLKLLTGQNVAHCASE